MVYQQPAAELLFDAVQPVANGRLRYLGDERLSVTQKQFLKASARGKCLLCLGSA